MEVGDLYGMLDPEWDSFTIERVIAVNRDKTLTVQSTWSYLVRNVKVDVLLKPDFYAVSSDCTELNRWARATGCATPLCKDEMNCFGRGRICPTNLNWRDVWLNIIVFNKS